LLSQKGARNDALRLALEPLVNKIDLQAMRRANLRVDVEKQSPRTAAKELLASLQR